MSKCICSLILVGLVLCCTLIATVNAGNDYLWGEISPNDYHLAKEKVHKTFFVGKSVKKKYVFKQTNHLDALTITAIRVTDKLKKSGATAVLSSGGPGSKGATILFTSQKGQSISDLIEIWGR